MTNRIRGVSQPARAMALALAAGAVIGAAGLGHAQEADTVEEVRAQFERQTEFLRQRLDAVSRQVDDLMFFTRLSDIADIDVVRLTGPPLRYQPNPTAQGAGNPFRFYSYVFIPRDLDRSRQLTQRVLQNLG